MQRIAVTPQVQLLDVASQASVRAFAKRWTAARRPLHVLVNNAGVFSFGGDRLAWQVMTMKAPACCYIKNDSIGYWKLMRIFSSTRCPGQFELCLPHAEVRKESPDGAEVHLATNCLGPHLLTLLLLPSLRAAAEVRDSANRLRAAPDAMLLRVSTRLHANNTCPTSLPRGQSCIASCGVIRFPASQPLGVSSTRITSVSLCMLQLACT